MTIDDRINIKAHVTAGPCVFVRAKLGNLWYRTALGFEFPVLMSEIGDATFDSEIKGMMMMRYIRKHAEFIAHERQQQSAA
ncbi:hypothetical protein G6L37_03565 [Agrobacterium rubi]|nr:hypothetical protein [Agrobacterium rubi]NTF24447.1 hypothetical protein [Agrobacterium rubi]